MKRINLDIRVNTNTGRILANGHVVGVSLEEALLSASNTLRSAAAAAAALSAEANHFIGGENPIIVQVNTYDHHEI